MIQVVGNKICSEINKIINSICSKEDLPQQWEESISVYKKDDNTGCSYYTGLSLLLTTYVMLFNILISRLTPYVDGIIGEYQCVFRRNRSTTDPIFCIRRTM